MTKERKNTIVTITICMLVGLLFCSCSGEDTRAEIPVERVLLVYMGGDNNLSSETYQKIEEIRKGWDGSPANRILVYTDPADTEPALYEIVRENTGNSLLTLAVYEEENSAGSAVMKRVIKDMKKLYPSSSYGLLVFSHASGWLPEGSLSDPLRPVTKSILMDGQDEMELADFAEAIPDNTFGYIVFETCFSAGIEVAYELRNKTNYILASSAEIVSPGFTGIYAEAVNDLFGGNGGLKSFAVTAFDHFNGQPGYRQSATFTIIDTKQLDELGAFVRDHCELGREVEINGIQKFDRYSYRLFFDFEDYYSRLLDTDSQRAELAGLIGKCVVWKASTERFMNGYNGFEIKNHSGLTGYIRQERFPELNNAYRQTAWGSLLYR